MLLSNLYIAVCIGGVFLDVKVESCLFLMQCRLKAKRTQKIDDDEVSKFNVKEHSSEFAPQFPDAVFFQIAEPLHILTSERLCLSKVLYVTDLLLIDIISCNVFLQLFLFSTTYFSSLLLALPQVVLDVLLHQLLDKLTFFIKMSRVSCCIVQYYNISIYDLPIIIFRPKLL